MGLGDYQGEIEGRRKETRLRKTWKMCTQDDLALLGSDRGQSRMEESHKVSSHSGRLKMDDKQDDDDE